MSEIYRNHPTSIASNVAVAALILIVSIVALKNAKGFMGPSIIAAIILGIILASTWVWAKTTICLEETQIVVESNIISKKRKAIPYSKIASANVIRGLFNRIFGTTTLQITINSSVGATAPNVNFVFKKELAEKIRSEIVEKTFNQQYDAVAESAYESAIPFKPADAVIYALIGSSSKHFLMGLAMIGFSVLMLIMANNGGLIAGIIMMIPTSIMPVIGLILKYYNFKVYRVGDNIRLEHGIIQIYRKSFDIKRINAVRIKRTLIARLLGRCNIEADVVGINTSAKDKRPIICMMIKEKNLEEYMKKLLPEFICEIPSSGEPKKGLLIHWSKTSLFVMLSLAAAVPIFAYFFFYFGMDRSEEVIFCVALVAYATAVAIVYGVSYREHKICEFGIGENMFRMVSGAIDRVEIVIQYDRVQISEVFSSPTARRMGLAKCRVSMLSSVGNRRDTTGVFEESMLELVPKTVMKRLEEGIYDYRENTV